MKEYSEVFDWYYDVEASVRICNTLQAGFYLESGVKLVDIFWSNGTMIYVFDKSTSKEAYHKWCDHDLGNFVKKNN